MSIAPGILDQPPALDIYESIIVSYIQGTCGYEEARYLTTWLLDGDKRYVAPQARSLHLELLFHIQNRICTTSQEVFQLWLLVKHIEDTVSLDSQKRILSWMRAQLMSESSF